MDTDNNIGFIHRIKSKKFMTILRGIVYVLLLIFSAYRFGITVGKNKDRIIQKYVRYYKLMCKWIMVDGDSIAKYFSSNGFNTIAIYGMGDIGRTLCFSLMDYREMLIGGIDRRGGHGYKGIPLYSLDEELPDADAVIITPFLEYEEIVDKLSTKMTSNFYSIEEVINQVYEKSGNCGS